MCGDDEYEKCSFDFGDNLEWTCAHCKKRRPEAIHYWTTHIIDIRRLQLGGYPFDKNDLTYEEWQDLGIVAETIAAMLQQQTIIPVLPGIKGKGE